MLRRGLCLLMLVGAMTCLTTRSSAQPAQESLEELNKKLQALRDQIEELRNKEQELANQEKKLLDQKRKKEAQVKIEAQRKEAERRRKEEAERKAKAEAEKKKHVAKVEIRGLLSNGPENANTFTFQPGMAWTVTINELKWQLNFGTNKNVEAEAKNLAGKPVVIKGTVVNTRAKPGMNLQMPPYQPWPNPWPNPQQPPIFPPMPQQWQFYPVEAQVVINVTSIVEAKD